MGTKVTVNLKSDPPDFVMTEAGFCQVGILTKVDAQHHAGIATGDPFIKNLSNVIFPSKGLHTSNYAGLRWRPLMKGEQLIFEGQ